MPAQLSKFIYSKLLELFYPSNSRSINEDSKVTAAIVQYPIPAKFISSIGLLEPQKDIDIVRKQSNNLCESCATAERIARIVESYAQSSQQHFVGTAPPPLGISDSFPCKQGTLIT
ncbi:hypothetical protein [Nostoc sp.]|uniref:hypothetical protein n=1 Tax=Nostoc sp. TaxID=1180 RepID=UPI002FF67E11